MKLELSWSQGLRGLHWEAGLHGPSGRLRGVFKVQKQRLWWQVTFDDRQKLGVGSHLVLTRRLDRNWDSRFVREEGAKEAAQQHVYHLYPLHVLAAEAADE